MTTEPLLHHVALHYSNQRLADRFFTGVLGMPCSKTMMLSKELSAEIFGIDSPVSVVTYEKGTTRFEVFLTEGMRKPSYDHVCITVEDTAGFIARCKKEGLEPFFINKDGKQLLFVRDFSGYLYEVK